MHNKRRAGQGLRRRLESEERGWATGGNLMDTDGEWGANGVQGKGRAEVGVKQTYGEEGTEFEPRHTGRGRGRD